MHSKKALRAKQKTLCKECNCAADWAVDYHKPVKYIPQGAGSFVIGWGVTREKLCYYHKKFSEENKPNLLPGKEMKEWEKIQE